MDSLAARLRCIGSADHAATWAGFVYVALVIDAFARRIVGWRVSRSTQAEFVLDALLTACVAWADRKWHHAQPERSRVLGERFNPVDYERPDVRTGDCWLQRVCHAYLSNDMLKANYSNSRLALLEFRRRVEAYQHAVMVWQVCRRVWARWLDTAVMAGALDLPGYERRRRDYTACAWLPPKWDWVDPLKDARAEIERKRPV